MEMEVCIWLSEHLENIRDRESRAAKMFAPSCCSV